MMLRFGAFELDAKNGELRKGGVLIKLPPQPLQVLQLLAENAGELQTREQIQQRIWGNGTFVDFDRNLNVCVAQIRAALNDDPEAPRFIQTVPRKGYRFLGRVEKVTAPAPETAEPRPSRRRPLIAALALILCASVAAGFLGWRRFHTRAPAGSHRVMLAALPFDTVGGSVGDEPFIDGLTDELITHLGSLHPGRLGVIARSSVMRYKGAQRAIDQVGRELGVDYVIEGTVRHDGDRVRVTARLVKVSDQAQLWTEAYEQQRSNLFQMEQQAAAQITASVTRQLFPGAAPARAAFHALNREAYDAYRNGRYLQHKGGLADLERSVPEFEQAARLDPAFAEAHAAIADARVALARSGASSNENFDRAKSAAQKSLDLDESNVEAHNALGNVSLWRDWNWKEAERHFTRAIEINPSFAAAHHDYAWFLIATGRTEAGLASLRRAMALDPFSARINMDAGWLLLQAHRFAEAAEQARRALELEPGLAEAHACLSRAFLYQGNYGAAVEALGRAMPQLKPELSGADPQTALQRVYQSRLKQAEAAGTETDAYNLAMRYAFVNDKSKALDALEQAYQAHSVLMPLVNTDPAFSALHSEARFQELVRKMQLP